MLEKIKEDIELIKQGKLPKLEGVEDKKSTQKQEIQRNLELVKNGKLPELPNITGKNCDNIYGLQNLNSSNNLKRKSFFDCGEKQR